MKKVKMSLVAVVLLLGLYVGALANKPVEFIGPPEDEKKPISAVTVTNTEDSDISAMEMIRDFLAMFSF